MAFLDLLKKIKDIFLLLQVIPGSTIGNTILAAKTIIKLVDVTKDKIKEVAEDAGLIKDDKFTDKVKDIVHSDKLSDRELGRLQSERNKLTGQKTETILAGSISNSAGFGPLAGAEILFQGKTTKSDQFGEYVLKDLVHGSFKLEVRLAGFKTHIRTQSTALNRTHRADVFLNSGTGIDDIRPIVDPVEEPIEEEPIIGPVQPPPGTITKNALELLQESLAAVGRLEFELAQDLFIEALKAPVGEDKEAEEAVFNTILLALPAGKLGKLTKVTEITLTKSDWVRKIIQVKKPTMLDGKTLVPFKDLITRGESYLSTFLTKKETVNLLNIQFAGVQTKVLGFFGTALAKSAAAIKAAKTAVLTGIGLIFGEKLLGTLTGKFTVKSIAKTGLAVGGTLAGIDVLATWLASDNVITGAGFSVRNLKTAVKEGVMTKEEALTHVTKIEGWVKDAVAFVDKSVRFNPTLIIFKTPFLINNEKGLHDVAIEKRILENIGKEDEIKVLRREKTELIRAFDKKWTIKEITRIKDGRARWNKEEKIELLEDEIKLDDDKKDIDIKISLKGG